MINRKIRYALALMVAALGCVAAMNAHEKNETRVVGQRMTVEGDLEQSQRSRSWFSKIYPDAQSEEEELAYFEAACQLYQDGVYPDLIQDAGEQEGINDEAQEKSSSINTSHLGAYHYPRYIAPFGDSIVLEDGSRWAICSSDTSKVLKWLSNDCLVITPNHDWFSSHDYKIRNLATNQDIRVNLVEAPYYNGLFTHWIVAIDYTHKKVCLEDGSVWSISVWDGPELERMCLEDTIIIGINDSWFKSSRPNILINIDTLEYIKARCDY